jgi:integral membrane protein
MSKFFTTSIGRLRLYAFLEGVSLLILVFIGMPMKYFLDNHSIVRSVGPVHGALFLLFLFGALTVGVEQKWKFTQTTWKVILASFIPFGTFYLDHILLRKIHAAQ